MEDPAQGEMLARLRGIFALEAEEYLQTITNTVLALEHEQDQEKEKVLLETLFRCIHSLKGAARAVNFHEIEEICQVVESVCASLKRKEFSIWPEFFDTFHRVMDAVRQLSTEPEGRTKAPIADIVAEVIRLEAQGRERVGETQTRRVPSVSVAPVATPETWEQAAQPDLLANASEQDVAQDEPLSVEEEKLTLSPERLRELFDAPSSAPARTQAVGAVASTQPEKSAAATGTGSGAKKAISSADVVRVETAKLDSLFLQAEEMLAVKLKTNVHASELRGLTAMLEAWKREWALVHTDIRKTQRILEKEENRNSRDPLYEQAAKLVDFLDWTYAHFKTLDKALTNIAKVVVRDQQSLGGMVDILLEEAKKVLMLPFSSALEVLPKMARDLSRAQGKEVEFVLQGGDIEVDKRILEEIKDPLIHILRNCIDHGIESPAERERRQKPRCGSLVVAISPGDGNSVEIVVQDNGAGIDAEKVRDAAVRSGIISREAAARLSEQEAIVLIFQSEVSTSDTISDISGRGLGMAIVREKVEKLGGLITVETHLRQGTTFRIVLPLTLATFRGVLVQSAGQTFVVPTASVERVIRIHRDAIHLTGNRETISMAGRTLPLLQLERVLGLATKKRDEERGQMQLALMVGQGEQQVAFGLDAVLNEQEVLFKGLGPQLVRVRHIAGATILGSGQVAPVLNVNDLLTAVNGAALSFSVVTEETAEEEFQRKSILVAEDSITSRMLLKEILESAGYVVSTAIDGEDAFSSLQKAQFDLVVSDVEMPRMNGFDLTSKIRDDERYAHLPVVLVTGLESQADRERGVNVGANAYVVKGSFDQSNLLETIRQFL
jgi:two-component system chemotaxis sensor kinase CheA